MQSHLISRRSLIKSSLIGLACSAAPALQVWLPPTVRWKTASSPF